MDFKELMRIAKENKERAKKECAENKRYDTKLPPPKKAPSVSSSAVRARLRQKEQERKEKAAEEERKKQELLKLRAAAAAQAGKKSKSKVDSSSKSKTSSKESQRSRDDKGSSSSRHHDEEHQSKSRGSKHGSNQYEDEEHESRHQHFMDKVAKAAKKNRDSSDSSDSSDDEIEESREKMHKPKKKGPALPKGPISFDEIMRIAAERQKGGGQSAPSPSVTKQQDDGYRTNKINSSFNKNHRDRKDKHVTIGNGHLKEAAEKYKAKNSKTESGQSSSLQRTPNKKPAIGNGKVKEVEVVEKYKSKFSQERPQPTSKPKSAAQSRSTEYKNKSSSQERRPQPTSTSKNATQSRITEYTNKGTNKASKTSRSEPQTSKKPDKMAGKKGPVQMDKDRRKPVSSGDRERPHASHMDRDRPRSSDSDFRRPVAKKRPAPPLPRMKAKFGRLLSDDEDSDYEDDGFIDDTPLEEEGGSVSSYIKEIFGYDKSKYGYESDYALRFMDASYKDVQREEARSTRLGMMEDLEDMRKEKEEEMRKKKGKSKKGKR
ncbi:uncharacterized protein [Amphiura filiformis]|uniref:uncharacterized protein n=1 Tax=Amphiura filiformis TaxID=82378 RepID=UPI003B21BD93